MEQKIKKFSFDVQAVIRSMREFGSPYNIWEYKLMRTTEASL